MIDDTLAGNHDIPSLGSEARDLRPNGRNACLSERLFGSLESFFRFTLRSLSFRQTRFRSLFCGVKNLIEFLFFLLNLSVPSKNLFVSRIDDT